MKRRVEKRNELLDGRGLFIDENAFNTFLERFEPLQADEKHNEIQ